MYLNYGIQKMLKINLNNYVTKDGLKNMIIKEIDNHDQGKVTKI